MEMTAAEVLLHISEGKAGTIYEGLATNFLVAWGLIELRATNAVLTPLGHAMIPVLLQAQTIGERGEMIRSAQPRPGPGPGPLRVVEDPPQAYELAKINDEKLTALSAIYGVSSEAILNVVVSDAYDAKVVSVRDSEGE